MEEFVGTYTSGYLTVVMENNPFAHYDLLNYLEKVFFHTYKHAYIYNYIYMHIQ